MPMSVCFKLISDIKMNSAAIKPSPSKKKENVASAPAHRSRKWKCNCKSRLISQPGE